MGITGVAGKVVNYVMKNPKKTAALAAGGVGIAALIGYKAATTTRKQANDQINHMLLMNPMLNPLGWFQHLVNPGKTEAGTLDNPFIKLIVDKNNKEYQEYYDNLSHADKIKEFYKNGGRGFLG